MKKRIATTTALLVSFVTGTAFADSTGIQISGAVDQSTITAQVNQFLATPGVGAIVGFFQVLGIVWLGFSLGHKIFKAAKERMYTQLTVDALLFIVAAIVIVKPALLIGALIYIAGMFSKQS